MNKSCPVCSNVPYFCLNETIFAEQVLISEIAQCRYMIAIIKKRTIAFFYPVLKRDRRLCAQIETNPVLNSSNNLNKTTNKHF